MTVKKRTKHVLSSTLLVVKLELWPAWVALHNWIRIVGLCLFSHNSFYFLNEMNISNQVRTNCTICYVPISHQKFNVYKNTHTHTQFISIHRWVTFVLRNCSVWKKNKMLLEMLKISKFFLVCINIYIYPILLHYNNNHIVAVAALTVGALGLLSFSTFVFSILVIVAMR